MKDMIKCLTVAFGILLLALFAVIMSICLSGKGKIESFYAEEGGGILQESIAERVFVEINGRKNGMIIRGKNEKNPVLLFISGGPGVPQYWMNEYYDNKIEEYFTVCWWDYCGEGLSYDAALMPEDITLEKLEQDAVTVSEYLKERFGKQKIYLMAHSGGTMLGLRLAQQYPEHFYCYFAMGQKAGDRYQGSYSYLKAYFEKNGNKTGLRLLEKHIKEENGKLIVYNASNIGSDWEKALLMAGCATTREMRSDCFGIFIPQMYSECYTMKEKLNYWRGKALCQKSAYAETVISVDHEQEAKIPVYFISGKYDYTCPVTLVNELYKNLKAPEKEMYIFENSAHSPLWEQNKEVLEVMLKHVG